jgi:alkanesulfonate monooxygenase SsuD/methylene tetrahydromethanopterin reductase-like flavin-dependent oxidoreductase (luciferase family)
MKMQLSMFMQPQHPPSRNAWETLAEDREAILLADQLGFAEAYVGEHVTDLSENITSCLVFLASVAHDTKNIVLGTGTLNLPNSHPAAIASQVAMLDHILEGRLIMGISPGGLLSDAEAFGNLDADRNAMFQECINMVLAIWAGEAPYDLQGKYWSLSTRRTLFTEIGQGHILKPYQKPHPPIVGTVVAPYSKGLTEMAKRGWTPMSANFLMPEWVRTHWPKYVEGCEAVGGEANTADWRVAKSIFVADNDATARRYGVGEEGPYYAYFEQVSRKLIANGRLGIFKPDAGMPDEQVTPEFVTRNVVIAGTVSKVVDEILAYRDYIGDFGHLVYAAHDWMDPGLSKRSMQLMAEEVMPRVNSAIRREGPSSAGRAA